MASGRVPNTAMMLAKSPPGQGLETISGPLNQPQLEYLGLNGLRSTP
jgi:hypothetical protein